MLWSCFVRKRKNWLHGMFSMSPNCLEKRRLRGNLVNVCKCLRGGCQKDGSKPLVVLRNRTRGNGQKVMHRELHLNRRKNIFTVWMTKHWNRLPREDVESPSLKIFKNSVKHQQKNWSSWSRVCPWIVWQWKCHSKLSWYKHTHCLNREKANRAHFEWMMFRAVYQETLAKCPPVRGKKFQGM